jgi:hypothetical protein
LTGEEVRGAGLVKGLFGVTGEELRSTALVKGLFAGPTGKNVSRAGADFV